MTPAPDPSTIFRAEALEHHARAPALDTALEPAPRWIRGAYWAVLLGFGALAFASFAVRVPRDVRAAASVRIDGDGRMVAWASMSDREARAARPGVRAWLESGAARAPLVIDGVDAVGSACATAGLRVVRAHGSVVRGTRAPSDGAATLVIDADAPRLIAILIPPLARVVDGHHDGS